MAGEKQIPPNPPLSKGGGAKGIQAVERALAVVEYLAGGEILEWQTLEQIAGGAQVPMSSCHRILASLEERRWVEKSPRGWRQGTAGIIRLADYARAYLERKLSEHQESTRIKGHHA